MKHIGGPRCYKPLQKHKLKRSWKAVCVEDRKLNSCHLLFVPRFPTPMISTHLRYFEAGARTWHPSEHLISEILASPRKTNNTDIFQTHRMQSAAYCLTLPSSFSSAWCHFSLVMMMITLFLWRVRLCLSSFLFLGSQFQVLGWFLVRDAYATDTRRFDSLDSLTFPPLERA